MKLPMLEKILTATACLVVVFTLGFFIGRATTAAPVVIAPSVWTEQADAASERSFPSSDGLSDQALLPVTDENSGKIDINTADKRTLAELPGIGEALADRIIAYREENGPFKTTDDLKAVPGIGAGKFDAVRDRIKV